MIILLKTEIARQIKHIVNYQSLHTKVNFYIWISRQIKTEIRAIFTFIIIWLVFKLATCKINREQFI